jgi:hypothetical protein
MCCVCTVYVLYMYFICTVYVLRLTQLYNILFKKCLPENNDVLTTQIEVNKDKTIYSTIPFIRLNWEE